MKGGEILKKVIEKRFPADTDLEKEMTFLKDSKMDGELYGYLQSISMPINKVTTVMKSDIPAQSKLVGKNGILPYNSPKTYRAHLKYLIDTGYVIEKDDRYELPNKEEIFVMLSKDTTKFLVDTIKEYVIKIYIYLGQRYKYKPGYLFTYEEVAQHIGVSLAGSRRVREKIHNALDLLQDVGLISFEAVYVDKYPRLKLTSWNTTYHKTKMLSG